MKRINIREALFWVGVAAIFAGMGLYRMDPDFGQHLATGRLILEKGIPRTDPFSYTMPSFPYIDHAWLTDVSIARAYEVIGLPGLAAVYGLLTMAALKLVLPDEKSPGWWIPVVLAATILLPRGGIRPQVEDWLLLAVTIKMMSREEIWKKWRWTLPLLFGLWTNLHGGVVVGLAVVLFVRGIKAWEARRMDIKDIGVWLVAVGATCLNPYGPRMWQEVWMTLTDSNLRWSIGEWMPFFFNLEPGFLLLLALTLVIALQYWREMPKWRLGLAGAFLLAGLSSLRHMAFFALAAIPVCGWGLARLYKQIATTPMQKRRINISYAILGGMAIVIGMWDVGWTGYRWWRTAQGGGFYPVAAVEFLKEKNYPGQLFAEYGWGGYLIWKYPEKKTFVDGRMPSMRWKAPNAKESDWAFKDYLKIINEGEIKPAFEKYDVGVVLWPVESQTPLDRLTAWLAEKFDKKEENKSFLKRLEELGWRRVYADSRAVVYVR